MEEQPQQLPHLVVDEPKRNPWQIFAIIVLSVMLLAIPLGVNLLNQRTQLSPQAAVATPEPELATGVILESKFSPSSAGGVTPVNVYIKSSADALNLAQIKLKFDPALLSVQNIATEAGQLKQPQIFNKWLEASSNNTTGDVSLIAGVPNPGIKSSDLPEGKIYMATVFLSPKQKGSAVLQIGSDSLLLKNSDNQNIFTSGSDIVLNFSTVNSIASSSAKIQSNSDRPVILVTSPLLASNYSFFKPIDINWSSFNVDTISQINLYINGSLFGPIASNVSAKEGRFSWVPQDSLSIAYVQPANSFSIEILGTGKKGEAVKALSGQFGITGQGTVLGSAPPTEAFMQNQLSLSDASRLLSDYLSVPVPDKALDFNKDEVINDLDFYLLRENLAGRGIVK